MFVNEFFAPTPFLTSTIKYIIKKSYIYLPQESYEREALRIVEVARFFTGKYIYFHPHKMDFNNNLCPQ